MAFPVSPGPGAGTSWLPRTGRTTIATELELTHADRNR
jgi:hypothetical protein